MTEVANGPTVATEGPHGSAARGVRGAEEAREAGGTPWLFPTAFGIAVVADQLWWNGFEVLSLHGLVVLAAGWLLVRPDSVGRLAALLVTVAVSVTADLPVVGSHRLVELAVAVGPLADLGWTTVRLRRVPGPDEWTAAAAPLLAGTVLVVYAFAALAKTNSTFLDPAVSCAGALSRQLAWWNPGLLSGRWYVEPAIWGPLAAEAVLPVLLALRRTRLVGLALGIGFHAVLALAGNVPFSAVMLALYVGFLPARVQAVLPHGPWSRLSRRGRAVAAAVAAAAWFAGAAFGPSTTTRGLRGTPVAGRVALVGTGARLAFLALAVAAIVVVWRSRRLPQRRLTPSPAAHPVLIAVLAALVLNGACPYLGLKTDTSFEMFSDLRTEPGAWNSLIVPQAVRVLGFQDGAVQVVASNDPALLRRTAEGGQLVPFELDRYLRSHPGSVATVIAGRGGHLVSVGPLPPGVSLPERLLTFKDLTPPSYGRC